MHRGVPQPLIHDEFSYLLAADTFAHGRITNPSPPYWVHLETPQQLMRPTYMSKYPPGQGLALALGQVLTGKPIVGAWLSTAAAVAAIYWMLLGFVSGPWALLGGLLTALQPQLVDWSQVYWGGSVAVIGSALLIGSWGRLMLTISTAACIILAMGLIVLANTRPFEGLVLSVPLIISLVRYQRQKWRTIVVAAGVPLLLATIAMGYYNFRITGRIFRIPYLEYASQYEIYPKFWLMPPRTAPVYRNGAMEFIHRYFEKNAYAGFSTMSGALEQSKYRFNVLFTTLASQAVLLLPLVAAILMRKELRVRWIFIAGALFVAALWTEIFVFNHYLAPLLPAAIVLILIGWRNMHGWSWRGRPIGRGLALAVAVGFFTGAVMAVAQPKFRDPDMLDQQSTAALFPQLNQGRHVIFVSYSEMHSYHAELVHNLSDLQASRILWMRDRGDESNREVAALFSDRQIWLMHVGGTIELKPFQQGKDGGKP